MVDNPRGFIEGRNLGGRVSPITRMRQVKADNMPSDLYAGDPVVLVSGNTVRRIPTVASLASLPVLGVVRAVYQDGTYPSIRPLTHSLPSTPNRIDASTAGWVEVNEDPHQTYIVNSDSTVVSTLIGQFVDVTANTPNTAAGRSGMSIRVASGANTAANTVPFQVVGIAPNNLDGIVGGENNQDLEIILARPVWGNTNKAR